MPAEHTGLLKENYLWKVLLRRGLTKDGRYILAHDGLYDHELFSICWGPVVTALGYVFDKAMDSSIYYKSIQGFRYLLLFFFLVYYKLFSQMVDNDYYLIKILYVKK